MDPTKDADKRERSEPSEIASVGTIMHRKGKLSGKGRPIMRKSIIAKDDGHLDLHSSSSPDARLPKRNKSTEPGHDRKGNMYYQIDPDLMTNFMDNVKNTQKTIQLSLEQQQAEFITEKETRRREMLKWYEEIKEKVTHVLTDTRESIKQTVWAENSSARLTTPDVQAPWREEMKQTARGLREQNRQQADAARTIAGTMEQTSEQVGKLTVAVQDMKTLENQVSEITTHLKQQHGKESETTTTNTNEEIKRLIGVLGGKIDTQNDKMNTAQQETSIRMDHMAQQHKNDVGKLEQSIWAIANQQTELKNHLPSLIKTEIEGRMETNPRTPKFIE